jgi:hypothetical protein
MKFSNIQPQPRKYTYFKDYRPYLSKPPAHKNYHQEQLTTPWPSHPALNNSNYSYKARPQQPLSRLQRCPSQLANLTEADSMLILEIKNERILQLEH